MNQSYARGLATPDPTLSGRPPINPTLVGKAKGDPAGSTKEKPVDAALDHLKQMPGDPEKKGSIQIPFPLVEKPRLKLSKKLARGAQHMKVPIDDLVGTQRLVKRKRVARLIQDDGDFSGTPTIVQMRKLSIIMDGHHRATADKLLGKKAIHATVLNLDQ